jgi:hypothetical protein
MGKRVALLLAGGGAILAGVALDRRSSGTPTADVSLALLLVASVLLGVYVWLEARSLT